VLPPLQQPPYQLLHRGTVHHARAYQYHRRRRRRASRTSSSLVRPDRRGRPCPCWDRRKGEDERGGPRVVRAGCLGSPFYAAQTLGPRRLAKSGTGGDGKSGSPDGSL
jgi:hypothetical protein